MSNTLEKKIVYLIDNNWDTANFTPKPTIAEAMDYANRKDYPANSVIVYPHFLKQTQVLNPTFKNTFWTCRCETYCTGSGYRLEQMHKEVERVVATHSTAYLTGCTFAFISDGVNHSDKSKRDNFQKYWIESTIYAENRGDEI